MERPEEIEVQRATERALDNMAFWRDQLTLKEMNGERCAARQRNHLRRYAPERMKSEAEKFLLS